LKAKLHWSQGNGLTYKEIVIIYDYDYWSARISRCYAPEILGPADGWNDAAILFATDRQTDEPKILYARR